MAEGSVGQLRPRVAVVTDVPFWQPGRGDAARILSLLRHLGRAAVLEVLVLARPTSRVPAPDAVSRLLAGPPLDAAPCAHHATVRYLPDDGTRTAVAAAGAALAARPPHVCILEYLRLAPLLEAIPAGTARALDTHDLVSERARSFREHGRRPPRELSPESELAAFQRFDKVMLIQARDHAVVSAAIGAQRTLLVPHAVSLPRRPLRQRARIIGFVASRYAPNVDALNWFLRESWPSLSSLGVKLHVFGGVGRHLDGASARGVKVRGLIPDLASVYAEIDVAINPVRFGAGLKIKNVEALASGVPLVTTPEGARGLEPHAGDAFLLGRDAGELARHVAAVVADTSLRARLADRGHRLARERFSPEACYGELVAWCRHCARGDPR